ncbi:hypothetical protein CspHIS471_0602030 [Cutaneotrichosporon sp. HIS471]|nr:hypothetical protein CspHIS471_0602030 [Cutaneotrichosporon sp. HIS471]
MGRFLDSVLKRPSRSYAAEASYPWDRSNADGRYVSQTGSDLGIGPSRRRTASLFSNDSEPGQHHHLASNLNPAQPRHSFAGRRGPSPVPEEPRRNSFSAKPSKGALFDGDLPPLPPIPSQHQHHVRFRQEAGVHDVPRAQTIEHAEYAEHRHVAPSRRDSRSRQPESGPPRPKQPFPQPAYTQQHPPSVRTKDVRRRINGPADPPHLQSPPLDPEEHHSAGSRVARRVSHPQSPPLARPIDRHIPSLTLAIAPPSTLSRPSPPLPLHLPASGVSEARERSGPTSPRVVQFADVVEYSDPPYVYSDEDTESHYSHYSHSSDERSSTTPSAEPDTPPRPQVHIQDDLPPVPPRSPKRGAPGARRDSIDSVSSSTSIGGVLRGTPPAPLVPLPEARVQTFHPGTRDSSTGGKAASKRPAPGGRDEEEETAQPSRQARPQGGPVPETRTPAPPALAHLPKPEPPLQLTSSRNPSLSTRETTITTTLSGLQSTPGSDVNSSTSSVPDTVLVSPHSPTVTRASVVASVAEEASSRRISLILDDAASEKSVYYTPRNSFYFNGNGDASKSSLTLDKIGEMLRAADDQEESFEMPGSWTWELAEVPGGSTTKSSVPGCGEERKHIPVEQPTQASQPAPHAVLLASAPLAQAVVEASAHVESTPTPTLTPPPAPPAGQQSPLPSALSTSLPTFPATRSTPDEEDTAADHESDDGSFQMTEEPSVEPVAESVPALPQASAVSDEHLEEAGMPHDQFSDLLTFHLQPPTPATFTDVMDSPFRDLDSPPLERELDIAEESDVPVVKEVPPAAPRSHVTSASSMYLDDEVDLDNFAPEEIAYYNPSGPAYAEPEPPPRSRASRVASHAVARPVDDTQKWYEPHDKSKPLSRTNSLARRQASGSGADTPPTLPRKSKRDRGGRVSGAFVQVLNSPSTPTAATTERGPKTRAATMVDDYTSSLQRSNSKRSADYTSSLQRSNSKRSVRSAKSTRSERSGTVSSQHTIVPDKPVRHAATSRAVSPTPPQPQHVLPRRGLSPSTQPMSPATPHQPAPEFRGVRRSSSAYDAEAHLSPPGSILRSSLAYETPRQSRSMDDWHGAQQDALPSSSRNSSDISASNAVGHGPHNRAVIGQGGWAAAAAEPIKMYVPTDGDGWSAFQPLPPRSRATPLPGSRNSSFDLGGRSSSSAACSSIAQSASGSVAGASQGSRMSIPSFAPVHVVVSPTSSVSGRVPQSRLRTVYHAADADESDEGERPSRSYASPRPDHPANVEAQRSAYADEYGARAAADVGSADYNEHYIYATERPSTHISPPNANGHWPADAFYDRDERSKAPPRAPSSHSSQYSAPSMYSTASARPSRLNSPLPPLPDNSSPYEAAARAHAARLGLASGLNPNVLTVLPEMSVQDSNELYLPQRRNSHKFGSSSSELGARGNMTPKRSASLFNVRRYSRTASDIGRNPRQYASSELARPSYPREFDRRHSVDPRRSSFGSRGETPPELSRTQSFRAPSRTGDYNPGDVVAPSNGTGVISLDTPSIRPLNNYPLMESNGYDQMQQNGYTNMVLPKGGNFKPGDPTKANGPDLQLLGVPPTSMAAITLSSALHTYHLKHESPTPEHLRWTLPPPVDFSTVKPPHRVSSAQILIQVYAVAVDWLDIAALDEKSGHGVGRWIPGRSFVGRCITTGVDEKEIVRGDVVIGLLDIRNSGALAEYLVADRRRVARVNPNTRLELEELAALPAQGIAVHRAIRDVGVTRGQQALVMDAHEGLPALFCQELTRMGLIVTAIVPGGVEGAQADALAYGARGVLAGSPSSVMHGLPENLFTLVIDTAGAADAARRILTDRGHILSLKSGDGPTQKHTLKTKLGFAKRKTLSASYVQPAGAGDAAVDASGLDYRDVLEEPVLGVLHPAVGEIVPFELGASVFASRRNMDRLRVAVVRIVN